MGRDADGNDVMAGDSITFDDITFGNKYSANKSSELGKGRQSLKKIIENGEWGDYIDWIFKYSTSVKKDGASFDCKPETCHIAHIAYSEQYQLLRVTFREGNVVFVYSGVPASVYASLYHANGDTGIGVDGNERSLVGIQFWNYVRVRGTRTGVRYDSTYMGTDEHRSRVGTRSEAAAAKARKYGQLTGPDGNAASAEESKAAKPHKALQFLEGNWEPTSEDIKGIESIASKAKERIGTIAYRLTHGSAEGKAKDAMALGEELLDVINSGLLSTSEKNILNRKALSSDFDEPYEPLIRVEEALVDKNLWPPVK